MHESRGVPFWQAFRVAAVLLRSVNAKNIFYRSREGSGPDAPGKQVAGLWDVDFEISALIDAD